MRGGQSLELSSGGEGLMDGAGWALGVTEWGGGLEESLEIMEWGGGGWKGLYRPKIYEMGWVGFS